MRGGGQSRSSACIGRSDPVRSVDLGRLLPEPLFGARRQRVGRNEGDTDGRVRLHGFELFRVVSERGVQLDQYPPPKRGSAAIASHLPVNAPKA
jgi:hypothetical protein